MCILGRAPQLVTWPDQWSQSILKIGSQNEDTSVYTKDGNNKTRTQYTTSRRGRHQMSSKQDTELDLGNDAKVNT